MPVRVDPLGAGPLGVVPLGVCQPVGELAVILVVPGLAGWAARVRRPVLVHPVAQDWAQDWAQDLEVVVSVRSSCFSFQTNLRLHVGGLSTASITTPVAGRYFLSIRAGGLRSLTVHIFL